MFPGGPLGRVPGLEGTVGTEAANRPSSSDVSGDQARFHPGRASPTETRDYTQHGALLSRRRCPAADSPPKYQARLLARLRRVKEAVRVALPTGSNLLLAEVASPGRSWAALDRVTRSPPSELRTGFARQLAARA